MTRLFASLVARFRGGVEAAILGNLASGLASGRYGARAQRIYLAGKGYATWTGAALAIVFGVASQAADSQALEAIAYASAALSGLGLVRKGAHAEPPEIPAGMRDLLEAGCSVMTWIIMGANGVVWICQQASATWACGISAEAQFASLALAAVSGSIATYVAPKVEAPATQ